MTEDESRPGAPGEPAPGVAAPTDDLPETTLEALPAPLREAAARAGWPSLMPVQARAIPYILAKRDIMVQSRTGSGKTGAFVLPILSRIDPKLDACQALVLVPTRELAHQVHRDTETLSGGTVRVQAVYGGVAYGPQNEGLKRGAHVVVGTPGRILDHLLRGTFSLDRLRVLVFDEADRMLSMGFYPDMRKIQSYLPERRPSAYLFSATYPPFVLQLSGEFLKDPLLLSLSRDHVHVAEVEHVFYTVAPVQKERSLVRILEVENPTSAIVFCNRRETVQFVTTVLQRFGYDADALSSDLSQGAREQVMRRLREGNLRYLVATDVAARGIDIPDLSHVIQFEPPEDPESYIHRAGRTGRAGAAGCAITLVAGLDEVRLLQIGEQFQIAFQERPLPTDADVETVVSQRLTALLEARLRSLDSIQFERMQRYVNLAVSLGQDADESYLVAMLLDDHYQRSLHAAPDRPLGAPARPHVARPHSARPGGGSGGSGGRRPRRR